MHLGGHVHGNQRGGVGARMMESKGILALLSMKRVAGGAVSGRCGWEC